MLGVNSSQPSPCPPQYHPHTQTDKQNSTGPHANGHRVYTGMYRRENVQRLFIHVDGANTKIHQCNVYSLNATNQTTGLRGPSADIQIQFHEWFRDVTIFDQNCLNHPVPNGQNPEDTFKNWRDSLLIFLDTTHGGVLWTRDP